MANPYNFDLARGRKKASTLGKPLGCFKWLRFYIYLVKVDTCYILVRYNPGSHRVEEWPGGMKQFISKAGTHQHWVF